MPSLLRNTTTVNYARGYKAMLNKPNQLELWIDVELPHPKLTVCVRKDGWTARIGRPQRVTLLKILHITFSWKDLIMQVGQVNSAEVTALTLPCPALFGPKTSRL